MVRDQSTWRLSPQEQDVNLSKQTCLGRDYRNEQDALDRRPAVEVNGIRFLIFPMKHIAQRRIGPSSSKLGSELHSNFIDFLQADLLMWSQITIEYQSEFHRSPLNPLRLAPVRASPSHRVLREERKFTGGISFRIIAKSPSASYTTAIRQPASERLLTDG